MEEQWPELAKSKHDTRGVDHAELWEAVYTEAQIVVRELQLPLQLFSCVQEQDLMNLDA